MDFVLWKPSKPGEPSWTSPAGIAAPGRPGWHIECSAMSAAHLGETFDIHGGGIDLVFPHHENEIAQSRCTFRTPIMAQVWMHNGFLQVEGEKMAKSAGNFVTVHELLRDWPGEVIRLNMLRTHHRQPIDWTLRGLEESERTLRKWSAQHGLRVAAGYGLSTDDGSGYGDPIGNLDGSGFGAGEASYRDVVEALSDDLNTPLAITIIHSIDDGHNLVRSLALMGIDLQSYAERLEDKAASLADHFDVETLVAARAAARAAKNFKEADRIRDELAAMGITLKDAKDPKTGELVTTWEVAR
jgi:cysteinyl-tRNA synthetase